MSVDKVKVIPKIVPGRSGRPTVCDLFMPAFECRPGMIAAWAIVGQHSEASIEFYHQCKNPHNSKDEALVSEAIHEYEKCYGVKCVRVSRQSATMRTKNNLL